MNKVQLEKINESNKTARANLYLPNFRDDILLKLSK